MLALDMFKDVTIDVVRWFDLFGLAKDSNFLLLINLTGYENPKIYWHGKGFYFLRDYGVFSSILFSHVFLLLSIPSLLVFCSWFEKKEPYYSYSIFSGTASIFILIITYFLNKGQFLFSNSFLFNTFRISDFSSSISSVILIFAILAFLIALPYLYYTRLNTHEYFSLLLLSCLSMLLMVCCENFLALYLCIELQALAFYVLASYKRNSLISVESGLKYFSLSAMASGVLLFGITLVYYSTGSIVFSDIGSIVDTLNTLPKEGLFYNLYVYPLVLGLLFIAAAFFFKLPAAPFHMWAADVYEGSPTSSTTFFLSVPKFAIFSVFCTLLFRTFYGLCDFYQPAILIISSVSLFLGYISALGQLSLKRFFAYSGISHVGFMLLPLGSSGFYGNHSYFNHSDEILFPKFFSLFFYLFSYSIMASAAMIFILLSSGKLNLSTNRFFHYSIKDLPNNLSNPSFSFFTLALLFSFIGIPPTLGFFGKFFVLKESMVWLNSLTLFVILFGIITFSGFVYGRVIAYMFFRDVSLFSPRYWWTSIYTSPAWSRLFVLLTSLTFLFFIYPTPLVFVCENLSNSFLEAFYHTSFYRTSLLPGELKTLMSRTYSAGNDSISTFLW